jgi:succinate dehydrogenase hydrophobic anchor subunit
MAMIPAVIAAYCFGEFFEFFILGKLLVVDGSQDYFSIANTWFVLFLLLILVVAVFRTWLSVRKILKQSPGNLIYERDHGS